MKSFNDVVSMDKITLQKIQFGIQHMMSRALLDDMHYGSVNDIETQSIIKRLVFYLWGNKVHTEEYDTENTYPATIWEELKRDFCPSWLKHKFPVRYSRDITHHRITHWHVCPHLNYKNDSPHLNFMMLDDTKLVAKVYEEQEGKADEDEPKGTNRGEPQRDDSPTTNPQPEV